MSQRGRETRSQCVPRGRTGRDPGPGHRARGRNLRPVQCPQPGGRTGCPGKVAPLRERTMSPRLSQTFCRPPSHALLGRPPSPPTPKYVGARPVHPSWRQSCGLHPRTKGTYSPSGYGLCITGYEGNRRLYSVSRCRPQSKPQPRAPFPPPSPGMSHSHPKVDTAAILS